MTDNRVTIAPDDLQFALDDLVRWCFRHRKNRGKRVATPDFNIKWGMRTGYTVSIRFKPRSFFYRGVEVLRTHKTSVIEAVRMVQVAAEEKLHSTRDRADT